MRMTCKISFDPLDVSPKDIKEALKDVAAKVEITFHNTRESSEPKPKVAKVGQ
jgi:hypothetical protein